MKAIKGRGLAGAQLTTSGTGEEWDMDQDPRLFREGTSELQRGGGLVICSAVRLSVGADLASLGQFFHFSFQFIDSVTAVKGHPWLVEP